MKRLSKGMAGTLGLCALLGTLAYTADQTILGKSFLVKDPEPGVDPAKRKIVVFGKELSPNDNPNNIAAARASAPTSGL